MGELAPDVLDHDQVTIGTDAKLILAAGDIRNRLGVIVINLGSVDVYLGNANVTTATGLLLVGTKGASVSIPTSAALYGICGSSQAVSYMATY